MLCDLMGFAIARRQTRVNALMTQPILQALIFGYARPTAPDRQCGVRMGGTVLTAYASSGRSKRIVIIGGGIGGLAAAVALRQRGFEVHVYERASAIAEVGAGLQVGPNAVKVLYALGLREALHRSAFEPTNMVSIKWDDASLRHRVPLKATATAAYGAPYMTAHRAHIHGMLRDALPDSAITLGATCVGAFTHGTAAVARFADGREVEADAVIGADGIRSGIRAQLFGADQPRFTEMMCWRCLVPMEHVPTRIGQGGTLNIFAGHVTDQWVEESWSVPSSQAELLAAYEGWNEALLGMFRHVR